MLGLYTIQNKIDKLLTFTMKKGYTPLFENESSHLLPETTRRMGRTYIGQKEDSIFEDEDDENVEFEMGDMRSRGKETRQQKSAWTAFSDFIERDITPSDTLVSLSFQYRCPVAEIKRINNLVTDQDFHALKRIKIPVRQHSILTDPAAATTSGSGRHNASVPSGESRASNSRTSLLEDMMGLPSTDISQDLGRTAGLSNPPSPVSFLKQVDEKVRTVSQGLPSTSRGVGLHEMLPAGPWPPEKKRTNGANCGIPWWGALVLALLITVCVPLFYLYYFEYWKPQHETIDQG